jgi:hypothetical protein
MRIASEFGFTPVSRGRLWMVASSSSKLMDLEDVDDGNAKWWWFAAIRVGVTGSGNSRKERRANEIVWPALGSEDTQLGVLMELEVGYGERKFTREFKA